MENILSKQEIDQFKKDGAVFLKGKFDINWIKKLEKGIERDIKNPSPRFKSHTLNKGVPAYLEDYWIQFQSLMILYLIHLMQKLQLN